MTSPNRQAPLRFITAGSVDDGKSTLIGRLLYDSKALLGDQIRRLESSRSQGAIDFSALTDGLEAEREQGITIDVAYRYFATARRKFIIADTPGHEQYTRNMVTGASTAHAAVLLIDAAQLDFSQQPLPLLPQTKRHSAILRHLRCPHIIVAVNKMDLLGFSQEKFNAVVQAYRVLADTLGLPEIRFIPISALHGDNIVHASERTPWYGGGTLLSVLEQLPVGEGVSEAPQDFHFPVQLVQRADGSKQDDFRGYQGRIEAGSVRVGDQIRVEPAGLESSVSEIISLQGSAEQAAASPLAPQRRLAATLCWFDSRPLTPARRYLLKHSTRTVSAKITAVRRVWDVHTLSHSAGHNTLEMNDLGEAELSLAQAIVCTPYAANPDTGAFILIDDATNHTVAAGMILADGETAG
ncbi:sulfate adenylyltransferase subunit 1 [Eikenella sp. Marseille-P7795]|uniref:sulfate adenylyltransferase subunit 1 n=1 Tax=Eikenella sp. Marseille-P7795 TaxID=2866577 RepID=UPI001CE47ED6|nr:GTP-binding protein [Eikenella sp. Marseille-P7795]